MEKKYHIIGLAGAGSLIAEFLFRELKVEYDITFMSSAKLKDRDEKTSHPLGKIPVLICPDGSRIFETVAITNHITDRYSALVPKRGTQMFDRYWQFLSLLATSVYPAYHRQHHSRYYVNEEAHEDLRSKARLEQVKIFDYINCELQPYICGNFITAADLYLYMLLRWDLDKTALFHNRPALKTFWEKIQARPSVKLVLENQPKRKP